MCPFQVFPRSFHSFVRSIILPSSLFFVCYSISTVIIVIYHPAGHWDIMWWSATSRSLHSLTFDQMEPNGHNFLVIFYCYLASLQDSSSIQPGVHSGLLLPNLSLITHHSAILQTTTPPPSSLSSLSLSSYSCSYEYDKTIQYECSLVLILLNLLTDHGC